MSGLLDIIVKIFFFNSEIRKYTHSFLLFWAFPTAKALLLLELTAALYKHAVENPCKDHTFLLNAPPIPDSH